MFKPPLSDSLLNLGWLLLSAGLLLILQRSLHRQIQGVFLLLTRNPGVTQVLFALLFFPGVLLHELSHYLMARLLGVRTGRFSLIPVAIDAQRLQLGYVETAQTDLARDALIGMAPLLSGGGLIAYIGWTRFGLPGLWTDLRLGDFGALEQALHAVYRHPDFWLWLYLAFVISSTMLPSRSDRRAWLPAGVLVISLVLISLLVGAGPWLMTNLALPVNAALRSAAFVFSVSTAVHLLLLLPIFLVRLLLERLSGLRIA